MSFSSDNPTLSNQVPVSFDVNPEEKNFNATLMLYLRRMANSVNTKDQGLYLLQETGNFQQWFNDSSPVTVSNNRNGYRLTVDMVALNLLINSVSTIPAGTTTLQLTASSPITQPPPINGYLFPTRGFGGAIDTSGVSYFPSDPNIEVTFTGSTNTFTIINNTGNALTQFYWVMEYLKN
jgi:hypothetical protein